MRRLLALAALSLTSAAGAQQVIPVYQYPSPGTPPFVPLQCDVNYQNCKPYSSANPMPVSIVSGGGSGGGGPATIADGADTSEGATTAAAYTDATGASAGTVNAINKGQFVALSALQTTSYQLLSNASASGAVQTNVRGGGYIWNVTGTFGGATVTLTVTDAAGVQQPAQVCTVSPCNIAVNIGQGSSAQAIVSGGTPSGLYGKLGGLGGPLLGLSTPLAVYDGYQVTPPSAVSTTVSTTTATTSAAFTPQLGRPINLLVTGTWAGTVQLFRSIDGGATKNPLTYPDGSVMGSFTVNAQTQIAIESDPLATYYVTFTLTSGSATARVS